MLAILAVLAAVVIPSVTGMSGHGASQAFDTDEETIKMACSISLFDTCDMSDDGSELGHWHPTSDGDDGTGAAAVEENVGDDLTAAGFNVIYMDLLVNTPALKVMILKCLLCELQYSICPLSRAI
jgi:hypothetical protein